MEIRDSIEQVVAAITDGTFEHFQASFGEYFLSQAPLALQLKAIENFSFAFEAIEDPSHEVLAAAIKAYPGTLFYMKNPTPSLEYLALVHDQEPGGINLHLLFDEEFGIWDDYDFSTEAMDRVKPGLGDEYQWMRELGVDRNTAETQIVRFMAEERSHLQVDLPSNLVVQD